MTAAARAAIIAFAAAAAIAFSTVAAAEGAPPRCLGKPATILGGGLVKGTAHADVIFAGPGADRIDGRGGNDRICSHGGADVIEGGVGSDRVDSGAGGDEVIGGNGSDEVLAGPGTDTVRGKRGNDRLYGGPGEGDFLESGLGDDTLDGGPGALDQVIGGVGNDRLAGGPGDGDLLRPDYGRDTVDGGEGAHDTVSFAVSGQSSIVLGEDGVHVDLGTGLVTGDGEDTLAGTEDVIGTAFADTISGDASPNVLYGGGGIDDLIGIGPGDLAQGGVGKDRCRAAEAQDSCELPGRYPAYSAAGEARFLEYAETGGKGRADFRPTLQVDSAGGASAGSLTAVVDFPNFYDARPGVEVAVSIVDGAWLLSVGGIAVAVGDGCEALSVSAARCPISGTPEAVLLSGTSAADALRVDPSVPATVSAFLRGYRGADTLEAGAGDDSLDGYISREGDVLRGGAGDDALTGGALLEAGPGSDLLIAFPCNGETVDGGPGVDSVSFARADQPVEAEIGGSGLRPGGRPPARLPLSAGAYADPDLELRREHRGKSERRCPARRRRSQQHPRARRRGPSRRGGGRRLPGRRARSRLAVRRRRRGPALRSRQRSRSATDLRLRRHRRRCRPRSDRPARAVLSAAGSALRTPPDRKRPAEGSERRGPDVLRVSPCFDAQVFGRAACLLGLIDYVQWRRSTA